MRKSSPSVPWMVSLPVPPSTMVAMSVASPFDPVNESSPPFMRSDQGLARPDVDAERRGRDPIEADAGAVGRLRELLGAVAAVHLDGVDAVAALVQVGVVARVPDHPVVAGVAEGLVVGDRHRSGCRCPLRRTAGRCRPCRGACRCRPGPTSTSAPEPPVRTSLPVATDEDRARQRAVRLVEGDRVVAGRTDRDHRGRVGDGRRAGDRHGPAVDQDRAGRVAAEDDGVVQGVTADDEDAAVNDGGDAGRRRPRPRARRSTRRGPTSALPLRHPP